VRQYILGIRRQSRTGDVDEPVGFVDALRRYLAQLQERHGLTVHLSLPTELAATPVAPEVETQLLRIIQEALTNVRKHAGVTSARLLFTQHPEALQVVIADDGRGFETGDTRQETRDPLPHFGLAIMQERAAGIGGEVEIRSTPGVGTQVIVHLPRQLKLEESEGVRGLRVLLVDDHPLYLDGLRTMLAARGVQVVGMARDGLQAQQLAHTLYPDLILMDVEMPVCTGIEATRAIKMALPQIKIVMLTVAAEEATLFEALKLGASGYLLKNLDSGQFFHLLREVMRGETVLSPRLATQVLATFAQDAPPSPVPELPLASPSEGEEETMLGTEKVNGADADLLPTLTHRQQAVLKLVVQGWTNKEIAKELSITERTVKYHIGLILERLQLRSRYELARYAQEQGFTAK
jgi:DNA-binding NarL/FixJ family response regulator/anti-sigma regulatory factor (Ser/Thr protein kinase)